jgi:hypothetical protein
VTPGSDNQIPIDQARLRPHLRPDQPDQPGRWHPATPTNTPLATHTGSSPTSSHHKPEPGELRGIPIQAKGVGGTIQDPDLEATLRQLDDWPNT